MITATHITKRFKTHKAVDDVSLHVEKGQIFGLLGPNAAGKTTVIRMLCGIIENNEGAITINGQSVEKAKSRFGYVAQYFGQYEELTVWENIRFYAEMYGIKDHHRLHELLKRYALEPFKNKMAGALSGGYQRRLALACALAHDPDVLFLDEPTAGIDPVTRKLLWDDFYDLSAQGKTLFVTTHYMEEAQRCHQLAFMANGRVIATGTPTTIKDCLGEVTAYSAQLEYHPKLHKALSTVEDVLVVNQFGTELRIVANPALTPSKLDVIIKDITGISTNLTMSNINLEDVFIALTQNKQRAQDKVGKS